MASVTAIMQENMQGYTNSVEASQKMYKSYMQSAGPGLFILIVMLFTLLGVKKGLEGVMLALFVSLPMITVFGLLMNPLLLTLETVSGLKDAANAKYPAWVSGCIDESVNFGTLLNIEAEEATRDLASRINVLFYLIFAYIALIALGLIVVVCLLIAACVGNKSS